MCPGVVCVGVFVVVVAVGVLLERIWTKDLHPGHIMRVGVSSLCFLVFGFCVFSFFFLLLLSLLLLLPSFSVHAGTKDLRLWCCIVAIFG